MAPMARTWTAVDFAFMFLMWAIMMIGMMAPSAAPMILIYARVARQSAQEGRPLAATGWFAVGYLASWTAFSVFATIAQGLLERAALLTPMMASSSDKVSGVVLIAAGIYQFTALKNTCLSHCQSPFAFIQSHGGFKRGTWAPIELGMRHGFYCIGCCWALMAVLFVVGVMNILWIAAIAIYILLEKVLPRGAIVARVAGTGLMLAGSWLLLS
jgi:predicted metal-binding membrane protein